MFRSKFQSIQVNFNLQNYASFNNVKYCYISLLMIFKIHNSHRDRKSLRVFSVVYHYDLIACTRLLKTWLTLCMLIYSIWLSLKQMWMEFTGCPISYQLIKLALHLFPKFSYLGVMLSRNVLLFTMTPNDLLLFYSSLLSC